MEALTRALVLVSTRDVSVVRAVAARGIRVAVGGVGSGRALRLSRRCAAYGAVAASPGLMAAAGEDVLAAAMALARANGAQAVIPADVPASLCALALRERLPEALLFPVPDAATLALMDDKWTFYEFLKSHDLPSPRTWLVGSLEEALALPRPLVLKPRAEWGGWGVCVVRGPEQVRARLTRGPLKLPVLAQEFIEGEDVDLSFLASKGRLLAWAVQTRREDGTIDYLDDARAVAIGRRMAQASGYTGLAHVDMRYAGQSRGSIHVIECNPRFWGSFPYTLGLGVDFLGLGLDLAGGREPPAIAASPVGAVPGIGAALKGLLSGEAPPEGVLQRLSDPAPELYRALRKRLGLGEFGASPR